MPDSLDCSHAQNLFATIQKTKTKQQQQQKPAHKVGWNVIEALMDIVDGIFLEKENYAERNLTRDLLKGHYPQE